MMKIIVPLPSHVTVKEITHHLEGIIWWWLVEGLVRVTSPFCPATYETNGQMFRLCSFLQPYLVITSQ